MLVILALVVLLIIMVRLLKLHNAASAPTLHCHASSFNRAIINTCPLLSEIYSPPLLWGKSGHMQTLIYGKLGRVSSPLPEGERIHITMSDGAQMTFDLFEPHCEHPSGDDLTLVMCPGIANSSESLYIRTCVDYAQQAGYRVAVLNHLGAIKDVRLATPRIFTYGDTEEYGAMMSWIKTQFVSTHILAIGFSMGGNIVLKYLGERAENQHRVLAAMSFCQGYDAAEAAMYLSQWENLRKVYLYAMTQHQKKMINWHKDVLLNEEACGKYNLDCDGISRSKSLVALDEAYSRRRFGFDSVWDYYDWASCKNYLKNIYVPTLMVNTLDDPIIPSGLLNVPREFAMERNNVIFATLPHGGHLGFFEGGMLVPDTLTWLDKMVVQYADSIVQVAPRTHLA